MYKVVCFGEVLWDVFPTYKIIGGAPLNVALRLQSLGINASIISCIGDDKNGEEVINYCQDKAIDTSNLQVDASHNTGRVNVTLDEKGSPTYEITYPVAWDKIKVTSKAMAEVESADAFIFGSLACRDKVTKTTLLTLLRVAKYKVFDVNIRPPFYSIDLLLTLMKEVDFIKCNDEEIDEICEALAFAGEAFEEKITFLAKYTQVGQICVTKGKDGAILFYNDTFYQNNGYQVRVADTVGAGDSFLAALISKLLLGSNPEQALDFACAVGALVASKKGANPDINTVEISNIISSSSR